MFLGAGASNPLGFADTKEFKQKLEGELTSDDDKSMLEMLRLSGYEDIEEVLRAIESLLEQKDTPGYDLFRKTGVWTYVSTEENPNTDSQPLDATMEDFSRYEKKIKDHVYDEYSWKDIPQEHLNNLYNDIFSIMHQSDDGIHVFTTNYDQVMERYIDDENNTLSRVDGFTYNTNVQKFLFDPKAFSSNQQDNNDTNEEKCYLYKLHGSLNWVWHDGNIRRREDNEKRPEDERDVVIFPTLSPKDNYYEQIPFNTLRKQFQERVQKTDVFIVVGYSFRDDLINKSFVEFLSREKTMMFVISPNAVHDTGKKFSDKEKIIPGSLDLTNSNNSEWIGRFRELCAIGHIDTQTDLHGDTLERQLKECLSKLGINEDANVYNLVGKIGEIDSSILDIIPEIYRVRYNQH